jgi:uncharacterized protein (TIGR02611 family)
MTDAPSPQPGGSARPALVDKLVAQREAHKQRSRVVRYGLMVVGVAVLVAGIIMLVTPGPAFVLIPIGLAILSLEFSWAEKLLDRALVEAEKAQERAKNTTPRQRALGIALGLLALAAAIAVVLLVDVPILPDN